MDSYATDQFLFGLSALHRQSHYGLLTGGRYPGRIQDLAGAQIPIPPTSAFNPRNYVGKKRFEKARLMLQPSYGNGPFWERQSLNFLPPSKWLWYYGLDCPTSNDMIPPKWPNNALYDGKLIERIGNSQIPDQTTIDQAITQKRLTYWEKFGKTRFFVLLPLCRCPHVPLAFRRIELSGQKSRREDFYGECEFEEIDWAAGWRILNYTSSKWIVRKWDLGLV